MAVILIVFHTQTGNTERLARAVAQGVEDTSNINAIFKRAADTMAKYIKDSSAIIICSPEYFGYMAGAIKNLFDRTYEELKDDNKVYKKPGSFSFQVGSPTLE
ncbi:MAG: flavodoxin family protein [Syntrophorhabdus sp.]|nr:flavodoxin family protein [Syntrophorhabdus sp.]